MQDIHAERTGFMATGGRAPGWAAGLTVADLRGTLYSLHAILRLHTAQEDEAYLSLGDDAETVGGGRP
jgi:hypothetical protein